MKLLIVGERASLIPTMQRAHVQALLEVHQEMVTDNRASNHPEDGNNRILFLIDSSIQGAYTLG